MALEGSLRDFNLFSLLPMIQLQGKHGTLSLTRGEERILVTFEQGLIVACEHSALPLEQRLGALLVRRGLLSPGDLAELVRRQEETLTRLGALLLARGKVTERELEEALEAQALAILQGAFRWTEGSYRFETGLPPGGVPHALKPLGVDALLMDAARIQDEWPQVERRLPPRHALLGRTAATRRRRLDLERGMSDWMEARISGAPPASGLSHEQEVVLSLLPEPRALQALVEASPYDELDTCKALAELLEAGWLEVLGAVPNPSAAPAASPGSRPGVKGFELLLGLAVVAAALFWIHRWPPAPHRVLGQAWREAGPRVEGPGEARRRAWVLSLARDEVGATMGAGDAGGPRLGPRP